MKTLLLCLSIFASATKLVASYIYAGDITFYQDSLNSHLIHFEVTILAKGTVDSFVGISWGVSDSANEVPVADSTALSNGFFFEKYVAIYNYASDSADSIITIAVVMQNRISGIENIDGGNGVGIPFCIRAVINLAALRNDSFVTSPVFLASAYVIATAGSTITYDPQVADLQGDSLSIQLVTPAEGPIAEVPDYVSMNNEYLFTGSGHTFSMDTLTGAIKWDTVPTGLYDLVYQVSKYRHRQFIGSITRDMLLMITDANTGIKDVTSNNIGLRIYPNPTTGPLKITPPANTANYTIEVTNLLGQTVYKTYPTNNQIDVTGLAPGIYLLKLMANGSWQTVKFVMQ